MCNFVTKIDTIDNVVNFYVVIMRFLDEISPFLGVCYVAFIAIFMLVAIRIWISNRYDDCKLRKKIRARDKVLTEEAERILYYLSRTDDKLNKVMHSYNWKNWFIKGYIEGATSGNYYSSPFIRNDASHEYTVDEWQRFQKRQMGHIKDDSNYFGGNKGMALYAYFSGQKMGCKRYSKKEIS